MHNHVHHIICYHQRIPLTDIEETKLNLYSSTRKHDTCYKKAYVIKIN